MGKHKTVMTEFVGGPLDGRVVFISPLVSSVMIGNEGRLHSYRIVGDIKAPAINASGHRVMRHFKAVAKERGCNGG